MKVIEFPGLALTIKREALELYISDLSRPLKAVKTDLPINIRILKKPIPLANVSTAMISKHITSKQNIFVAWYQARPVGYLFATSAPCWVGEICDHLKVASKEIYLFNAYAYPGFRGKHIYQNLLSYALKYYKKNSYIRALIFTTQNNISSRCGIKKAGFKCFGHIHFSNFLGRKIWQYSRRNSDSQSYFMHEINEN